MKWSKEPATADPGSKQPVPADAPPSWADTLARLHERFVEDRLAMTAGSLTFMTLIALVPLLAVALAVFTAFPAFASFQRAVEELLLQNLAPDKLARPAMDALNVFAANATGLGALGLGLFGLSALALLMTIDRTLNELWRVRRPRPFARRLFVYAAALTCGPLVLGASLTMTSYLMSASRGVVAAAPGGLEQVFAVVQFLLLAAAATGLFRFVPNTEVRWSHAAAGGLFVAVGIEVAKRGLAWYVGSVPTFESVYGAFAIVPILLMWVHLLWVVVLLGAVVAAYAPALGQGLSRWPAGPGARFSLGLALIARMADLRRTGTRGATAQDLAHGLRCDPVDIESLVETLESLGWVTGDRGGDAVRFVLCVDPAHTPAAPLIDRLLLAPSPHVGAFRRVSRVDALSLADLLGGCRGGDDRGDRTQRGRFSADLRAHGAALGLKGGDNRTAAADLPPATRKSEKLPDPDRAS